MQAEPSHNNHSVEATSALADRRFDLEIFSRDQLPGLARLFAKRGNVVNFDRLLESCVPARRRQFLMCSTTETDVHDPMRSTLVAAHSQQPHSQPGASVTLSEDSSSHTVQLPSLDRFEGVLRQQATSRAMRTGFDGGSSGDLYRCTVQEIPVGTLREGAARAGILIAPWDCYPGKWEWKGKKSHHAPHC